MDADPDAGDGGPDLRAALEAERAAVDHWRRIALQRSEDYAALGRRPSVRVVLAVERRLATNVARAASSGRRLRAGLARVALSAGALRRIGRRRPPAPLSTTAAMAVSTSERQMALVVVGPAVGGVESGFRPGIEVTRVAEPGRARAALARSIAASAPEMVGVVAATTEPRDAVWLDRLAAAIDGGAVAATPLALHPYRPPHRATAHDGLISAAGVRLRLDRDGAPLAERVAAGTTPQLDVGIVDVDAGSGAALLMDRAAYEAAGGLAAAADDLDVAVVELCAHLRSQAGRVVMVPSAVVVNHGRVRARRELRFAVDPAGPTWAAAIGRSGAVLRRAADPRACPPLRLAVTVAAPSAKVADRWGDWHLAHALARSLRRQGVEVRVQTADQADDLAGRACDVHLVLRGVQPVRRTAGQRHVLWIISHPESVDDDELHAADLVLVASLRFADDLQRRTDTPVEVMLQATDHRRFQPRPPDPGHCHDVTIVAKTRDVLRPVVADAIAAGLRPSIYGGGWRAFVDPALVVADHVDNATLPVVYSSAGVVLNDHWRPMRSWGFVSNRLFDVLACGTPVISDHVDGVDELFDGAVLSYRTPEELRALVDDVLADPVGARQRAERGREVVLAHHTFDHRASHVIDSLARCTQDQARNGT
jgi:glycosyltransferase involved in cell wall biosynthesis